MYEEYILMNCELLGSCYKEVFGIYRRSYRINEQRFTMGNLFFYFFSTKQKNLENSCFEVYFDQSFSDQQNIK